MCGCIVLFVWIVGEFVVVLLFVVICGCGYLVVGVGDWVGG